jgi:hypothetical protein
MNQVFLAYNQNDESHLSRIRMLTELKYELVPLTLSPKNISHYSILGKYATSIHTILYGTDTTITSNPYLLFNLIVSDESW